MPLRALALSLVALLVPVVSLAQDPPEYSRAMQLVQQQQWAAALDQIQDLRKQYPGNPKVENLQGLALLGSGDANGAIAAFQRVIALRPDFFPALKNLAVLESGLKRRGAAAHIEQALKISPQDPVLNAYAALYDLQRKDAAAAGKHLDQAGDATSAMPPEIEMRLAYLLGTNGLYPRAARVFQDLMARSNSPTLRYNLGLAQYLAGDYQSAIQTLEEAESHRRSSDILNLLAQSYDKNRQTQLAIDTLRKATALFPTDENNYLDLATICIDHNAYPLGIEVVRVGLKNKPGSERLLFQLGLLHALSGQFDLAREEFQKAGRMAPGKDLPVAALGLADIQQNGREDTIRELRKNLKQKGDSAILCYLLGSSLVRNGARAGSPEYAEARAVFQKAIRLDPGLPYPYIELGKMYEQAGKILEAIPLFEKAAVLGPRDPSAYYHLARNYQKLNQPQKAEQMLNKLKEIYQNSREFERMGLTKPEG
ncbi:MAG: tetratricopeptide repeat protein [Terriglobales bacterium]